MEKFKKYLKVGLVSFGLWSALITNVSAEVILHAFNWSYRTIGDRAEELSDIGYKKVLVVTPAKSQGDKWWARYQPQDLRIIDHELGNKADFQYMIDELAKYDIGVYADVVLNHMANEAYKRSDLNYPGFEVLEGYREYKDYFEENKLFGDIEYNIFSDFDFNPNFCITDWTDNYEVKFGRVCGGEGDPGLPDLKESEYVVQSEKKYIEALAAMGVAGFRVDAAKHMTNYHMNRVFESVPGAYVFGEIIIFGGTQSEDYKLFLGPYLDETRFDAYDFSLLTQIRVAFDLGGDLRNLMDPQGRGDALADDRAVTVAVTHDIANDKFEFFLMNETDEFLAHTYIMTKKGGTPMVYSEDANPGHAQWRDLHSRFGIKQLVKFHNAVNDTDMEYLYSDECALLFRRGYKGIVSINKCGYDIEVDLDMNNSVLWWKFPYNDLLNPGKSITIDKADFKITLAARSASTWLIDETTVEVEPEE